MKKTYLDALMSIFTPIPLNNGFYFVDNNGTIDWILSNIFLLGYVLPVEGVMIGIFFYLLLSHAIEHKTQLMFREKFKLVPLYTYAFGGVTESIGRNCGW